MIYTLNTVMSQTWRRKAKKLANKGSTLISTGKAATKAASLQLKAGAESGKASPATAAMLTGGFTSAAASRLAAVAQQSVEELAMNQSVKVGVITKGF